MLSYEKKQALAELDKLVGQIPSSAYEIIKEGILDVELLRDRDARLEDLWSQFADVPMNPETECIEAEFMGWGPGIHREEIWHWFDKRHSKGVAYLLYGDAALVSNTEKIRHLEALCRECGSVDCIYNKSCRCIYPKVHETAPVITELDGCKNYLYIGGVRE